jgi:hypothetical protein
MPLDDIPWGLEDSDGAGAHSKVPFLPFYIGDTHYSDEQSIIIDEEDYLWAKQWRWGWNPSKNKKKLYVRRTSTYQGRYISVYLHKVICHRAWGPPPTPSHIISDHRNGNTLDCRRINLGWATPAENRQNYAGIFAMMVRLDARASGTRLLRVHTFGGLRGTDPFPPPAAQSQGYAPSGPVSADAPF